MIKLSLAFFLVVTLALTVSTEESDRRVNHAGFMTRPIGARMSTNSLRSEGIEQLQSQSINIKELVKQRKAYQQAQKLKKLAKNKERERHNQHEEQMLSFKRQDTTGMTMLQSPSSSSVVTQPQQQQQQQTFLMQQPQQQQLQEKQQPFDFSQMMAKFKQQTPATTTMAPLKTGQFMMSPASNSRIMDGSISSFNSNNNNNMMMNTMNSNIMKKKQQQLPAINKNFMNKQQQLFATPIVNMNTPCASQEFGTILSHPDNMSQFIICYSSDEYTIMDCPADLVYNPFLERCDHTPVMPADQCASNPCQNNGKCMQQQGKMECQCAAGFGGEFCDKKDSCLMKNCGTSDGTCVELAVGSPLPNVCRCAGGQAYGHTCTGALESNPCLQTNSNGIMFSTRLDPAMYVHCSGNKPHFQFCSTGLVFNMNRQYCDWSAQ